jgi:hypothetical protein
MELGLQGLQLQGRTRKHPVNERASGEMVTSPMHEVRGSSPVRDKDFSQTSYEEPNYLGLVTLTSFGWDNKPRSSVCICIQNIKQKQSNGWKN